MGRILDLLERADRLPGRKLVIVNLLLGLFVLFAHGLAVVLVVLGKAPELEGRKTALLGSIVVAIVVAGTSAVALGRTSEQERILRLHSVLFLPGALLLLAWGAGVVVYGLPPSVRFSWSPGLLTALVFYAFFLARRQLFLGYVSESRTVRYGHLWAGSVAAVLDLGVLARVILDGFGRAL